MRVKCMTKGCTMTWDPIREPLRYHQHAIGGNQTPAVVPDVEYVFVAKEPLLAHAFASHFGDVQLVKPKVRVVHGSIFDEAERMKKADPELSLAFVSPANSFGEMDGGIDQLYLDYIGQGLQLRVTKAYAAVGRKVPVGQALVVPTSDYRMPYLISAPTMYAPMNVEDTWNAYWAMKAVCQAVHEWNLEDVYMGSGIAPIKQMPITTVLVPGLCTGTGKMHPDTAARQMRKAYVEMELRGTAL